MDLSKEKIESIIIVGAGVSGLTLAILLARAGKRISIYDKRTEIDKQKEGRSINFTISGRGLSVLTQLGLKEKVLAQATALVGRTLHLPNSKVISYQYGTKKSQVLLSIRRSALIEILLQAIALEKNISFYPGFELINIDDTILTCHFLNIATQKTEIQKPDFMLGADGVFSTVRSHILKKKVTNYQQTVFSWGYKEYQFNRIDAEKLNLKTNYMHMWPKSNALLVAIPNTDNTFSVIFTAPLYSGDKRNLFDELVKQECGDIVAAAPSFLTKCGEDPFQNIISIKIDTWHLEDKIMLIGDACHATYPFYGQGMNSALEDAVMFTNCITNPLLSRLDAFMAYEKMRKKDMSALHQLSEAHLKQMTKAMISSFWQACNALDYRLAKLSPNNWIYEYEMVAHSTLSYTTIRNIIKNQSKKKLMGGFYVFAFILSVIIYIHKLVKPLKNSNNGN